MMLWQSTVATLSILVAVATALPYDQWNNARYRYSWNDLFNQEVGARVRSQAASVDKSSCAAVTETKDGKSYKVRLCEADPEDDPNKVCLGTRVNPCCSNVPFSQGSEVSSTKVNVGGETVTVTYYLTQDPTARICFKIDDAHLSSETCSQSRLEGISCLPPCLTISTLCLNQTLTGDSSSCDNDVCQCKTGYLPPDCCQCDTNSFYLPECKRFCRDNCRQFRPLNVGGCETCQEGYIGAPECCECDTAGNATHAFYKIPGPPEKCIPFCKSNCAVIGRSGCVTCKTGYIGEPECCTKPERCDKQQNLFFYIDATASNIFENFCPLMVVMQMLVAAFNPSPTSGTQIASVLFSDNVKNKGPSTVFDVGTSCFDAVQGSDKSLKSLMIDYGVCLDSGRLYDSSLFPSLCGEGTSAVKGLEEILSIASRSRSFTEGAIVMLTDGVIMDDVSERIKVLNTLKTAGISTLIAAGINEADVENLKLYTSDDNILVGSDPVQLGIDIVNKMEERGIVCKDHADNIARSLREAHLLTSFCSCHRKQYIGLDVCARKYPTCGGSLSIGLPNLPQPGRTKMQEVEDLEYVNQLLLEEEILDAVEKVLDQQYHG